MIVGLGNPGREYSGTRHNVGFEVIDLIAKRRGASVRSRIGRALTARVKIGDQQVILVKPQTFMNLSGEAVSNIARREKINPDEILVIYDDMALPLGKLRIRPSGSAGGHNGMKSIIGHLHTNEFPRLRVGIGSARSEAVDHVLSKFKRGEMKIVKEAMEDAENATEAIVKDGIEAAMNVFNRASE